ncbi:MAG: TolC family protein [Planctomycetota bacterium]|jgi:outer membrane protein TolC
MSLRQCSPALPLVAGLLALAGCASPFGSEDPDRILRRRVAAAIDEELEALPPGTQLLETTRPSAEVIEDLEDRREELAAIAPVVTAAPGRFDLGPDLTGGVQQEVTISLRSAIDSAVRNNLSIQIARLQPAITEADVVAAEAAFDAVFFSSVDLAKIDEPTPVTAVNLGGSLSPVGVGVSASDQYRFETGIRKPLTSGGEVFVSTDLTRFQNNASGIAFIPDPAYTSAIRLGINQPLLRGFGTSVNTASIRLSRNLERKSIQQLRADLLLLLDSTEAAYWDLVFAWQNLAIQEWLLQVGIQVRDVMERRRDFDTKPAEYSDAVARVEQRKGFVIEGRRSIRAASDRLKLLINDAQISVGSEALLVPADAMVEDPIRYNLREAILTSMTNRPEIQQAILDIDDAAIRQMLADNNRLPLLDVSAQMAYFGLDDSAGDSYDELFEGSFLEWVLGMYFELPIGNRAAEAGYRQARLQRSEAVVGYQRAVQNIVLDVKAALRDCITSYELIQASRSNRIAQSENLRTLLVEEETLAGLTPEFLNLKFQRQERLAAAQADEALALVDYNKSLASLYRAMGVGLTMNRIELEIIDIDESGNLASASSGGNDASSGQSY